jgi:YVTN family beta-propeller protein
LRTLWAVVATFMLVNSSLPLPLSATVSNGPSLSSVDLGTVPRGVAVDSGLRSIYAVLYLNGTTLALDQETLSTVARISTPSPYAIAVDPSTGRVYVSQGEGGSIAVIDGSTNSRVATVTGAGTPYALAVDETDNLVFCADTAENSLWIVNGSTSLVAARVPMGDTSALAVDPAVHEAFVGNLSSDLKSGTIDVVNTTGMRVIRTVPIPIPPGHFAADPASHLLFVTSAGAPGSGANFLAVDDRTFQTVYSERLGYSPDVMAVDSSSDVYVSDVGVNRLYEVDGATGQVLLNSTGDSSGVSFTGITSMAFDPQSGRLFITESDLTSLLILTTGSAPTSPDYLLYLVLAVPAIASAAAGILGILYLRRQRSARPTSL